MWKHEEDEGINNILTPEIGGGSRRGGGLGYGVWWEECQRDSGRWRVGMSWMIRRGIGVWDPRRRWG